MGTGTRLSVRRIPSVVHEVKVGHGDENECNRRAFGDNGRNRMTDERHSDLLFGQPTHGGRSCKKSGTDKQTDQLLFR